MLLDFKQVRDGRSAQLFRVEPDHPLLEGFFGRLTGELEVHADIREQRHRTFLVTLRVNGQVEVPCRRCLTPAVQPVRERADLLFEVAPAGRPPRSGAEELEDERLRIRSLHDRVDIGPHVREALFLAAEPYVVCREQCRGLCPRCGADLNATTCACQASLAGGTDERWAKLHDLAL